MKRIRLHAFLIHIYMFISVLAIILIFANKIPKVLLTLGASSWATAIGVSSAGTCPMLVGVFLLLWAVSFPILLLVAYIMACKKRYMLFAVVSAMDCTVESVWAVSCLVTHNMYSFKAAVPDVVAGILYVAILITSISLSRKTDNP